MPHSDTFGGLSKFRRVGLRSWEWEEGLERSLPGCPNSDSNSRAENEKFESPFVGNGGKDR